MAPKMKVDHYFRRREAENWDKWFGSKLMARAGGNAMAFSEPEVDKKRSQKLYNVEHLSYLANAGQCLL